MNHVLKQLKQFMFVFTLLSLCICLSACAETDAELWAAYQQPNVCTEGQAYLDLVTSVQPVHITDGEMPLWRFSLFITETNGVPFTLSSAAFTRFDTEHNVLAHVTYEGDELAGAYLPSLEYLPGETFGLTVNQPADASTHYGIMLGGVDANGNARAFRILVPLSHEKLSVETPESFKTASEGSTLIELTPSSDPVYLETIEFFDGGLGWSSSITVTNLSGSPVELTDMCMMMFTENGGTLLRLDYSGKAIAICTDAQSNILAPGESFVFSDLCPYQDMIGYGYRFTARAEDGSTQTANCYFSCVKEEKPE